MTALVWDDTGNKIYELGLDRGVLFLPDGSGVPWNGLISVTEIPDKVYTPIYFDGVKSKDYVSGSDFVGTMKAYTYPDEFLDLEGVAEIGPGVFISDQMPKPFGLSYRTKVGNDVAGQDFAYKLHLLYNVTAIPSTKEYETLSSSSEFAEFEWKITAVPDSVLGYRPSAHVTIDSRRIDPFILAELEESLYGNETVDAQLIPFADLMELSMFAMTITINADGSWTAETDRPGYIFDLGDGVFEIQNANATYLDADTYRISDTTT